MERCVLLQAVNWVRLDARLVKEQVKDFVWNTYDQLSAVGLSPNPPKLAIKDRIIPKGILTASIGCCYMQYIVANTIHCRVEKFCYSILSGARVSFPYVDEDFLEEVGVVAAGGFKNELPRASTLKFRKDDQLALARLLLRKSLMPKSALPRLPSKLPKD